MDVVKAENLTRIYESSRGFLKKTRKKILAVDNLSFTVKKGEIFGLLGPNGAGKTTTIKMLSTLHIPTSGRASVLGYDVVEEAKNLYDKINIIFGGERGFYWRLSGRENLKYFADLYNMDRTIAQQRIEDLLEFVGLADRADEKVETYSSGMKQKLHIARGLINDPEVLFLDEPTIGLDPSAARTMRHFVKELSDMGKTVFLTTHYMFEADELCNRIAIINKGNLMTIKPPSELKALVTELSVVEVLLTKVVVEELETFKKTFSGSILSLQEKDGGCYIQLNAQLNSSVLAEITSIFQKSQVNQVKVKEPTLEDAYLKMVGGHV